MTALFLAPHNDDETLFGAFTLLRYRPLVVICLRSYRMADPSYPGDQIVTYEEREEETSAAMDILGCDWVQLVYRDDDPDLPFHDFWTKMDTLQREFDGWSRVFLPNSHPEGNPQHNRISEFARGFLEGGATVTRYCTYKKHDKERGTEVEFESDWIAQKHAALSCYQSQASHPATREHFMRDIYEYYA